MSDVPFGFNRPGDEGDDDKPADRQPGQPADPFAAMGGGDMRQAAEMLRRFADMLSNQGGGGPLNWDMAKDIARHAVVEQGDPSVVDAERRQVEEALRLADLWLNDATTIPAGITRPWARSLRTWSAPPTSGCRWRRKGSARCCPRGSRPSAPAWRSRRTRYGSISPCARPRTSGYSSMCRGCARTCSAPWRTTPAASAWICPAWRRRSRVSTPATRRPFRRRCP